MTNQVVNDLDDLQYGLMEGPCVEALRESRVVAATRTRHDQRWPNYVSKTVFRDRPPSQLAIRPFLDHKGTLGGLNLYSTHSEEIDPEAEDIAVPFAIHAAIAQGQTQETTAST